MAASASPDLRELAAQIESVRLQVAALLKGGAEEERSRSGARSDGRERTLSAKTSVTLDLRSVLLIVGSLVGFGAAGVAWVDKTLDSLRADLASKADVAEVKAKVEENTDTTNETKNKVIETSGQAAEALRTLSDVKADIRDIRAGLARATPR
jgi:hypothetical protein